MYVTKYSSYLRNFPESISAPPEGPNSGYLVIQDQESETYSCFGLCKSKSQFLDDPPFPQNKELTVEYESGGGYSLPVHVDVALIPVLDKPLSSNQYYAIQRDGNSIGDAITSSPSVKDKQTCRSCGCTDMKHRASFDPLNKYPQFHIMPTTKGHFSAKSMAPGAFPPHFLSRNGWKLQSKTQKKFQLLEAPGIYFITQREVLPDFDFPISTKVSRPIVVGKWYCPFMFIKDGNVRQQVEESLFYEMTLERKWDQILTSPNANNEGNCVFVDVDVAREVVYLGGDKVVCDAHDVSDGVMWFRSNGNKGGEVSVGLRVEIVDRMKWEQKKVGVRTRKENQVRVTKREEFREGMGWGEFGCYVLVESFVLKKMDG